MGRARIEMIERMEGKQGCRVRARMESLRMEG